MRQTMRAFTDSTRGDAGTRGRGDAGTRGRGDAGTIIHRRGLV
jgi:hypothetical protein